MINRIKTLAIAEPQRTTRRPLSLSFDTEAQISRFEPSLRRELRRLARQQPRFSDLIEVFPGAAFAIASRQISPDRRTEALRLIAEGSQLKHLVRVLQLPAWLRKLPPEAFSGPLQHLPGSETFARRVACRLPATPLEARLWLATISFANRACHEEFALWLADQPIYTDRGDPERLLPVLAAYVWYSGQPLACAHDLIVIPWRPEIAFDTALCAAKSWLNRLRLVMQLEPGTLADSWLEPGQYNGFTFVPLLQHADILEEAHAMQNCADQYADRLSREKCRLFSVRRGATRVATLEIGPHPRETGVLAITQLKARHNMPAAIEVWQAAHAWLAQQKGLKRLPPMIAPERPLNQRVWGQLMAPYRQCTGGAPWLPDRATIAAFQQLDMDMSDLARRGGVTSWLFT